MESTGLIASAQAGEGSPLETPETIAQLAQASIQEGVGVVRAEGAKNVRAVMAHADCSVVGLIKRHHSDCEVYITPSSEDVDALLATGCEVISLDATARPRPGGETLEALIRRVHEAGRLVMADVDNVDNAVRAAALGADVVATTLGGYTRESRSTRGPDIELVREIRLAFEKLSAAPLLVGEGRYAERWQIEAALRAGAHAVTVGSALNDPVRNTRKLMPPPQHHGPVGVVDVGGTWLRMGVAHSLCEEPSVRKTPLPATRAERLTQLSAFLEDAKFERVGISSAGVVWNNVVTLSKKFIPENQGTDYGVLARFLQGDDPRVIALGDGHASAWAHANHPDFAGMDLVVLALGTGLGYGHVKEGRIVMGAEGLYSRLNDLPGPDGQTFEQTLGGKFLTSEPDEHQKELANRAAEHAVRMISTLLFPDVIIVCGTVGMQPWLNIDLPLKEGWPAVPVVRSPFGADAGLYGAAALALYPPDLTSCA